MTFVEYLVNAGVNEGKLAFVSKNIWFDLPKVLDDTSLHVTCSGMYT